ncbi:MAG: transcriptional repressor, partial [Candidatus Faecousia sp.]|nr:transcriptional repressor [Candidatus Faecousia sp.]
EMVYEMLQKEHPDISLATVYRNLARFKSQGLVTSVATVRGVERFDAMTHSHVHFICTGCDAVLDLPQMEIPLSLNEEAEKTSGCHVQDCRLTFTGLCGRCASK